jgi:hypothetical protein
MEIKGVIAFVAAMWAAFFLECVLPFDLTSFGLVPRTLTGRVGTAAAEMADLAVNPFPPTAIVTKRELVGFGLPRERSGGRMARVSTAGLGMVLAPAGSRSSDCLPLFVILAE